MTKIVGIDVSLTNTAMYFGDGKYAEIKGGKRRGVNRLTGMYEEIRAALAEHKPRHAIIEGYAYHANSRAHRLGEIGGIVRMACVDANVVMIAEVPPTSLKKFFTGDGRAAKIDMQNEAFRRELFDEVPGNDLADASALWCAGHDLKFLGDKGEIEWL